MAGKIKKFITSPAGTMGAFALAVGLLASSSVGGARAALTYYSETYTSRVQMYDIGVTLLENDKEISWRNYDSRKDNGSWLEEKGVLLENMVPEGEKFKIGVWYPEELKVMNSGTINQYVRVSLYKYWLDENGEKVQTLTPDLIDLELQTDNGWMIDEESSTDERTILYYNRVLETGETSPAFAGRLKIDQSVTAKVTQTTEKTANGSKIITTYDYDGVQFCIEATVDAVQEHNVEDAVWSAWGRKVTVNDGILSL
ncbi:MAG: hypothetical protein HFI17_16020 [Lachnospiraceae bacterium]|jgi:hypothetical protein|nr:hypothetical protein [Lachnospiraceae bacterium]MCI9601984.1 hypothetical protein [Lachnospiraceae bacterium]